MSVKVMASVWELDLPQGEKIVLLAFADHADDDGYCYPSIDRIAWKCGYSRSSVKRQMKKLAARGLLGVVDEGTGRGHTSRYLLRPEAGCRLTPFSDKGVHPDQERGPNRNVKGSIAMNPEPSEEPSEEPELELQLEETASPADDVFDYWERERHDTLGLNGSPRQKKTDRRMAKIRARLSEGYSVERLKDAIDYVLRSDFHVQGGHTDIELICRSQAKVEQYLQRAEREHAAGGRPEYGRLR